MRNKGAVSLTKKTAWPGEGLGDCRVSVCVVGAPGKVNDQRKALGWQKIEGMGQTWGGERKKGTPSRQSQVLPLTNWVMI